MESLIFFALIIIMAIVAIYKSSKDTCSECGSKILWGRCYHFQDKLLCKNCYHKAEDAEKQIGTAQDIQNNTMKPDSIDSNSIPISKRYPVLRIVSMIYIVISVFAAVATGLIIYEYIKVDNSLYAITSLLAGAFVIITCMAISESIAVVIDIEENTRTSAKYIQIKE